VSRPQSPNQWYPAITVWASGVPSGRRARGAPGSGRATRNWAAARRSWAATDAAEVPDAAPDADESTPADGGVSVPG